MTRKLKYLLLVLILIVLAAAGYFMARKLFPGYFTVRYRGTEILLLNNLPQGNPLGPGLTEYLEREGLNMKAAEILLPGAELSELIMHLNRGKKLKNLQPRLVLLVLSLSGNLRDQQQPMRELAAMIVRHINRDGSNSRLLPVTLPRGYGLDPDARKKIKAGINDYNDLFRRLAQANDLRVIELEHLPADSDGDVFAAAIFQGLLPLIKGFPAQEDEKLPPEFKGKIVFQSDRSGSEDIYLLDAEGVRALTANEAANESPCFSPCGKMVIFESNLSGRFELYVHELETGKTERLFPSPSEDRYPFWGGQDVIYFNRLVDGNEQVFRFNYRDRFVEQVTSLPGRNSLPVPSPDGKTILLTANHFLGWHVYTYDLTQGKVSRFSGNYGGCRAQFSNRGDLVAWVSHKADGRGDVFLTPVNDFQPVRLTLDDQMHDYYPWFSPDDRYIVYASGPQLLSGNWDLKIIEIATRKIWRITSSPAKDILPSWRY